MSKRLPASILRATALSCMLVFSGCGMVDGVELNGGIFDMLGVSDKAGATAKEPKVPERTGLVLPPDVQRLPAPGAANQQPQTAAANPQWPSDPEERKRQQADVAQRQHAEHCQREVQRKRAMQDPTPAMGPLGRCEASLLSNFGTSLQGQQPSGLPR